MKCEIAIDFYNCFSYKISRMETVTGKNEVLSEMEEAFRETVRRSPSCRDEISAVYQQLKIQCEHAS